MPKNRWIPLLTIMMLVSVGWMALSIVRGDAQDARVADLVAVQRTFSALAEEISPAVVSIGVERSIELIHPDLDEEDEETRKQLERMRDHLPPSAGSGVIIRPDGMVLTNEHVIFGAKPDGIRVTLHTGREYTGTVIGTDPRTDLAVIKIDADDLRAAKLADVASVKRGHWAIAMGNPFGLAADGNASMSVGIVSNIGRALPGMDPTETRFYANLIETDAAINPGSSGGPLLNIFGEVIGINTAISTRTGASEGVGFAVPMSKASRHIISQLIEGTEVEYGFLGVEIADPTQEWRTAAGVDRPIGARVQGLKPEDGPAAHGGLQPQDLITRFDDVEIADVEHLVMVVGTTAVGREVQVEYYRDGKPHTTTVTVARRDIGRLRRPDPRWKWKGMELSELTDSVRDAHNLAPDARGLIVEQVFRGTPADRSGFKEGEVIVKIGDMEVNEIAHVRKARQAAKGPLKVLLQDGRVRDLGS